MNAGNSVLDVTRTLGADDAARIRRVLEGGVKIPPQPRVLEELQKQMNHQEKDYRVLARTIQQDPGLTAMLFKVVGNAAYRQHQLNSYRQTIQYIHGRHNI